jgi:hypothetical protein
MQTLNRKEKYKELCRFKSTLDYIKALNLEDHLESEFNIRFSITNQQELEFAAWQLQGLCYKNTGEKK